MNIDPFDKFYSTLNENLKQSNKKKLNEAESLFKGGQLRSKKTKTFFHWKHGEKPALFDIDFKFTVTFDRKKIVTDYARGKATDWTEFYHDYIRPNFSEPGVWKHSRDIATPMFKVQFVTYGTEYTDKTLNPNRNTKYKFSHTITLEAKDPNQEFTKAEVQKEAQEFVKKIENIIYPDSEYYKITK